MDGIKTVTSCSSDPNLNVSTVRAMRDTGISFFAEFKGIYIYIYICEGQGTSPTLASPCKKNMILGPDGAADLTVALLLRTHEKILPI